MLPVLVGPEDAVDVDGVAGVFGVAPGQVVGIAGEEVVHPIGFADEKLHTGAYTGGLFELPVVEGVAFAVVEAVFADAGVGIGLVVDRAVEAEFDVFGKLALGLYLSGVRLFGVRFGVGLSSIPGVVALDLRRRG